MGLSSLRRSWHDAGDADRRFWYVVVAVIVGLLVIAWVAGWFGGAAPPEVTPVTPPATMG
jgi:hypothetical protein